MEWYLEQIREEIEEKRKERQRQEKNRGHVKIFLDARKPSDDQLLFVEAKTGKERRGIHAWAELNGFQHCAIITDHFNEVTIYHCQACGQNVYDEELYTSTDWSTVFPEKILGTDIKCSYCYDSYYDPDDPEYSNLKKKGKYFNAVLVAKELPLPSKREVRKRKKKLPQRKSSDDIKFLDDIVDAREIATVKKDSFNLFISEGENIYPRTKKIK